MIRNYFKVAIRNLIRQKTFSIINIAGLSIGLTVSFLILLFVFHEMSYDKFHNNYQDIYRVIIRGKVSEQSLEMAVSSASMAPVIKKVVPEIQETVRLELISGTELLSYGQEKYYEDKILYADTAFFDIFSFKLLKGKPHKAFVNPFSVVLTQSLAQKIFKNENPVGKVIYRNNDQAYKVTGVVADPPDNSHLEFNALFSFSTLYRLNENLELDNWTGFSYYTYIKTIPDASKKEIERKINHVFTRVLKEELQGSVHFECQLQPVANIHLHSDLMAEISQNGSITDVFVLSSIAFFIIIIACINFMNLTTARSSTRAREVGIRKVLGASRKMLIQQFLAESLMLTFVAFIIALGLIELILPWFNILTGKHLHLTFFGQFGQFVALFLFVVFIGLLSGSYPAFYFSKFKPVNILKGVFINTRSSLKLRNVLVVVQFTISVVLIICTGIIYNQLQYIENKKLGYNKENILVIPLRNAETLKHLTALKNELRNLSLVEGLSLSMGYPGGVSLKGTTFFPQDHREQSPWLIYQVVCDKNYVDLMGMKIVKGRNFSEKTADSTSILINETLAKKLGWENPLGKILYKQQKEGLRPLTIIGVVSDFHYLSLYDKIQPFIITQGNRNNVLLVKIDENAGNKSIALIQNAWEKLHPELPFDYFFLDSFYMQMYSSEKHFGLIFMYFTLFAIFIASIGLLGLTLYVAEKRTKEIGIRKALGASEWNIMFLLSKEFLRWVILAIFLAVPVSYFSMKQWLDNFEYNAGMPVWIFISAAVFALLIAIITINFQAIRIAQTNPVEALRYE